MRWLPIDSLNTGLDAPPEAVKRLTPRESIRSFLELTEQQDFAAAAHLLNLSELSAAEQREEGGELARQLAAVLRRGEWINASNLSGRQDAVIEDPSGQHPQAGQPRCNLQLASLRAEGQAYDIRLARYRVGEEDPVWLITPDSLSPVPLLYKNTAPPGWKSMYRHVSSQRSAGSRSGSGSPFRFSCWGRVRWAGSSMAWSAWRHDGYLPAYPASLLARSECPWRSSS